MKDDNSLAVGCVGIVFFVVLLTIVTSWKWYRAGVQAGLWRREGTEITQWEVFTGATPLDRNIRVQEAP